MLLFKKDMTLQKNILTIGLITMSFLAANAQDIDDVNGKTYYYFDETTKKKVKEIFHHIQEIRIKTDNHGNSTDTLIYIKNGPYTRYYESGKLECSGFYQDGEKNGTWKFYTTAGKPARIEIWAMGKLTKSTTTTSTK
jgi:antitoxin component YwqK of YwqJK toxin-antitoxin module